MKFASSKVTNLNLSHLIFVGGSNVCTRERVDTFDEAFLYWMLSKLEKYCALELSSSFGASPAKLKGLVYL